MNDQNKTKEQLAAELTEMRRRVAELEASETERSRAEETLLRAKREWERTFDSVPDLISILDNQYRILRVNQPMADRLGLTPEQCIGLTCYETIHGLPQPPAFCPHALTLADAQGHAAEVHEDRLGGDFMVTTTPLFDERGQMIGSVHVARNITERKRAEAALRKSHEELQVIYKGVFDGLLVMDIETKRFVRTNPALCGMLGYSEDELLSLSVEDIHRPEDLPNVLEEFKAQAEGRQIVVQNIPVLRKDGSVFHADISTTPIDYRGRRCNIGVFHDITARKEAEEALRREHRVLRQMLKAQDRERQLVAYEIHDGLAQQLTGATMQFEAYEKLRNENSQQASNCYSVGLDLLRESVAEARRLIAGLRPPILDEAGIVAAIAHLIQDVMARDGPEVEFHSSVKFKRLEPMLENAIFRIVQESLTNVCRHSNSDTARVELVQDGNHVRVEVRDWGIGFGPKSVEEKCFGLAGIRERARVLGGQVTIDSTPDQGTQIVVELPVRVSEGDLP